MLEHLHGSTDRSSHTLKKADADVIEARRRRGQPELELENSDGTETHTCVP